MKIEGIDGPVYVHVLNRRKELGFGDSRIVKKREWLRARGMEMRGVLRHGEPGMHASTSLLGVFQWVDMRVVGRVVCLVQLGGEVLEADAGKRVGEFRRVVAWRVINEKDALKFGEWQYLVYSKKKAGSINDIAAWVLAKDPISDKQKIRLNETLKSYKENI